MRSPVSRRMLGAAVVAAVCAGTAVLLRGEKTKDATKAPDFREKGSAGAPVVIVEYSDFQCPACRAAEPSLRRLLAYYGPMVRFIFKDFPLQIHPWARPAAAAAECAGMQGKFWPYHDFLYDRQDQWVLSKSPPGLFVDYAKQMGLDAGVFNSCAASSAAAAAVQADVEEGRRRWVGATPTFFINGRRFVGYPDLMSRGVIWIDRQIKEKKG